jgi:hypothetical protein
MSGGDDVRPQRSAHLFARILASLFWVCPFGSYGSRDAWAQTAPHIHLKGSSHIDVHASREPGALLLSGAVQDDTARPVPRARLRATLAPSSDPLARLYLAATDAEACEGLDISLEIDRTGAIAVTTDDLARFCIRVALSIHDGRQLVGTDRYVAHLETRGVELLDGSAIDFPVDLSRALVTLTFDPQPTVLPLDDESISVDVIASIEGQRNGSAAGLALSLSDERDSPLGSATTDASGRARFDVGTGRLGLPGNGELRAAFAGNAVAGAATRAASIQRRTGVDIVAPTARGDHLPLGSPEEGIPLELVARPRCARRGCRASPSGIVQVHAAGSAMVGAAPLDRGEAHVVIQFVPAAEAFATPNAEEVLLSMRYVSNVPWFLPGRELALVQPVRARSAWSRVTSAAPLLLAATVVMALLAFGRLPFRPLTRRGRAERSHTGIAGGQIQLVRGAPASQGWTGHVADAHDGRKIAHARLAVERPGFERSTVVAGAVSDATGVFALPFVEARPGDELVVDGPVHARLRRPLPPSGEIVVALVLRKRALLDRLVAWARRRGAPYDGLPEATPAHVRRSAGSDTNVARWASAVERAAYGGAVIDEGAQAEVERLAPPDDC